MKLKLFITHTLVFSAGMALMLGIFVFFVMPQMYKYIPFPDTDYIQLSEKKEPVLYLRILEDRFQSHLYLASPFYFFARDKGFKIDKKLAQQGYWPALDDLFTYHSSHSDHPDLTAKEHEQHYQEALKLAKFASERGYQTPMLRMIAFYHLADRQDITKELILVEGAVEKARNPNLAKMLATYYAEAGNQEKLSYYEALELRISEEHRPTTTGNIITPRMIK